MRLICCISLTMFLAKSFRSPSLALSNMLFLVIGPYAFSKASDPGGITNFLSILRRTVQIWYLIYKHDFLQYIGVALKNCNQRFCCTVGITAALLPIAQGAHWRSKQSGKFYFGKSWFFRTDVRGDMTTRSFPAFIWQTDSSNSALIPTAFTGFQLLIG